MKNYSLRNDKGEIVWISRSVAVVCVVIRRINNNLQVLIERRGNGVDNSGKLCLPCGYLDFNETIEEAVKRELLEETGFQANINKLNFYKFDSSPKSAHQNVSFFYNYFAEANEDFDLKRAIGGEYDETEDVKWLTIGHFYNEMVHLSKKEYLSIDYDYFPKSFEFAFNHFEEIINLLNRIFIIKNEESKN